ncbi:hypothetical protein HMPREF0277_0329 [Corynebacterium accolens ATCC 49726]|nr:hypothetical protein HMPREF0277_0329 [Corynebacterium accolens ATCC 49726]
MGIGKFNKLTACHMQVPFRWIEQTAGPNKPQQFIQLLFRQASQGLR